MLQHLGSEAERLGGFVSIVSLHIFTNQFYVPATKFGQLNLQQPRFPTLCPEDSQSV